MSSGFLKAVKTVGVFGCRFPLKTWLVLNKSLSSFVFDLGESNNSTLGDVSIS